MAISGRLIAHPCVFQPYISASVGVGFNHAYNLLSSQKFLRKERWLLHRQPAFVYTLGLTAEIVKPTKLQAAIGYEFVDWVNPVIACTWQTLNQGLSKPSLRAAIQLSLFYIIWIAP